jgi:ATP-binding cassette subfamily B protein
LLNLLQNLYPLKEGKITIGAFNVQYISPRSLRTLVAVVPQHIDLFAGTVIENIAPGDENPDLAYIIFLCKLLGIDQFIEPLPQSYYTPLQEQGSNLSGGQRQRLAIARALYKKPEILVLDEATSSLDPAAEHKVQEALQWFRQQGKTLIVITHRLATVQQADTIHVLQAGKLAESGTHEQLLANNGVYATLWKQ